MNYYFISTGRCGTTLISNILNSALNLGISHQITGSRIVNMLGNISLHNIIPVNLTETILRKKFGSGLAPDSTVDPLRSVSLYLFLKRNIDDNQYKIIHIVRDPRDFVTSFMNWKASSYKRQILHHAIPFWQPNPWLAGDVDLSERLSMNKFEHFCWIWNYKNELFFQLSERENYLCLRFEDLIVEKKKETWEELLSFLELTGINVDALDWPEKKVNKSKREYFPQWEEWTVEQANTLDKWCGDLMRNFNYGKEKQWERLLQ